MLSKPCADGVGRQERGDVDVEVEQVLDRARVLGAVQPLERRDGRDSGAPRRVVDARLRAQSPAPASAAGAGRLSPRRRHHARAQLADHLLGDLGVLIDRRRVEVLQRQPAGLRFIVVARRRSWPRRTDPAPPPTSGTAPVLRGGRAAGSLAFRREAAPGGRCRDRRRRRHPALPTRIASSLPRLAPPNAKEYSAEYKANPRRDRATFAAA